MSSSKIYDYSKSELQELLDTSNSYADVLRKIGMSQYGNNYETLTKAINTMDLDLTKIAVNREKAKSSMFKEKVRKAPSLEDIINGNYGKYRSASLRDRLIKEGYKEHRCENCGLDTWLGEKIPLHLHHVDGNHNNNKLENLQLLCPNCHSMTDNYAGKCNKKENNPEIFVECPVCHETRMKKGMKMCDECLQSHQTRWQDLDRDVFKSEIRIQSFGHIGEMYGVSAKTISRWCENLNLPHKKSDIKKYSKEEWEAL